MKGQRFPAPRTRFADRVDAGKALSPFRKRVDSIVLALPRGGVPVAYEVAKSLSLPLDIWLVRKLGLPGHEELAMGAIAAGDITVLNDEVIKAARTDIQIGSIIARERQELARRNKLYRGGCAAPDVAGKTVIVVDDGFATGATMTAALQSLRKARATWIVAAAPVGASAACAELEAQADEVVCPFRIEPFYGVGHWYDDFSQTEDEEVMALLNRKTA